MEELKISCIICAAISASQTLRSQRLINTSGASIKQALSELTPTSSKEATVEAVEMAQPVKYLLDNHKDPSSIPSNPQKSQGWQHEPVVPEMGDRDRNTLVWWLQVQ